MTLLPGVTILDLRPEILRRAAPLATNLPVKAVTLETIEDGSHGLTPEQGPFLVICERGTRSALAARYLRADGLQAEHWQAGWNELVRVLGEADSNPPASQLCEADASGDSSPWNA